jgi:hypothetical protein
MNNLTPRRRVIQMAAAAPVGDLAMIENIMRMEVFHSTLDWQTEAELKRGARQAYQLLKRNRELYQTYQREAFAVMINMKKERR